MYLMPPVAGVVAWFVTGESFTTVKLVGAAITLAGVAIAQFVRRPA
jgi:drug/metabolite transporter (DMT)-like permease